MNLTRVFNFVFILLFGLFTGAQGALPNLEGLPPCAWTAAIQYLGQYGDGCNIADFACHCRSETLIDMLPKLFREACSVPDRKQALEWAISACAKVGVSIQSLTQSTRTHLSTPGPEPTSGTSLALPSSTDHSHSQITGANTAPMTSDTWTGAVTTTTSRAVPTAQPSLQTASGQATTPILSTATSSSFYPSGSVHSGGGAGNSTTAQPPPFAGSGEKVASAGRHVAGFGPLLVLLALLAF